MTFRTGLGSLHLKLPRFEIFLWKDDWSWGHPLRTCNFQAVLLATIVEWISEWSIQVPQILVSRPICKLICRYIPGNLGSLHSISDQAWNTDDTQETFLLNRLVQEFKCSARASFPRVWVSGRQRLAFLVNGKWIHSTVGYHRVKTEANYLDREQRFFEQMAIFLMPAEFLQVALLVRRGNQNAAENFAHVFCHANRCDTGVL